MLKKMMNLEDRRWFALLSCFFVGSVTGMQYAFSVYSDALKDQYDLKQSEVNIYRHRRFASRRVRVFSFQNQHTSHCLYIYPIQ